MNFRKVYICILFSLSIFLTAQSIVKTIPLPGYWDGYYAHGLTFDGENFWVGDDHDGRVYCIDSADGTVLSSFMGTPDYNYGLAYDGEHFYIPSTYTYGPYYFYKFDTSGTIVDSVTNPVSSRYIGGLHFNNGYIRATKYYPNTQPNIYKIDTVSFTKVDSVNSPGLQPMGIAWDGTNIWISMDDNDGDPEKVYQIDPQTGNVLQSFDVPTTRPRGVYVIGDYLWLVAKHPDSLKGRLYKYDLTSGMPEIQLTSDYHNYGIVAISDTGRWNMEYSNIGNGDLIVDSIISSSEEFKLNKTFPETLLPDSTSATEVNFIPENYGVHSESLFIHSNDPINQVVIINLEGEAYSPYPDIVLSDSIHNYGQLWFKAKRYWKPVIYNMGLDSLEIDSIQMNGINYDFEITTPLIMKPQSDSTFRIWYESVNLGQHMDTVTIFSGDPHEPAVDIFLSGEAIEVNFDSSGTPIWYYQAQGGTWNHIRSLKILDDIDADGFDEVIASSENDTLYCFFSNNYQQAQFEWKFGDDPCWTERGLKIIEDMNNDGIKDILYGTIWGSRKVYLMSGATGEVIWEYDTHEYGGGGWVYEVSPFVDITGDGTIEVLAAAGDDGSGTGPRRIYCFNGTNGSKEWESQLSNYSGFGVRMIEDINGDSIPEVAASSGNGTASSYNVYLFDGASGNQIWMNNTGEGAVWTVLPGCDANNDDTTDIIAGFNGGIISLDLVTGDSLWAFPLGAGNVLEITKIQDINNNGSPEIIPQGPGVNSLRAIDCLNGSSIWSSTLADDIYCVISISDLNNDGINELAAGTGYSNNYVYLIDGISGDILHSIQMGSPVESIYKLSDITDDGFDEIIVGLRNGEVRLLPTGDWSGIDEYTQKNKDNFLKINTISFKDMQIRYSIRESSRAVLSIIDITGRVVVQKTLEEKGSGILNIDTENLSSGIYYVILKTDESKTPGKTVFIK